MYPRNPVIPLCPYQQNMCSHNILLLCCSRNTSLNSVAIKPSSYSFLSAKGFDSNSSLSSLPPSTTRTPLPSTLLPLQVMSIAFLPSHGSLAGLLKSLYFSAVWSVSCIPHYSGGSIALCEGNKVVTKEESAIMERQS